MNKMVDVVVTYLEQRRRPGPMPNLKPPGQFAVMRAVSPPVHFYRYLYRTVGQAYHWSTRLRLDDEALSRILNDRDVHLLVLYADGAPAGFAEIDNRTPAEITFFGLTPERIGKRLGRFFLLHVLDHAWSLEPPTLRIETCTLDHPAALPLYQKLGFSVVDRRKGVIEIGD